MSLVSVIIPTYNRSALVKEAIQSVWEQQYRPIECIVVDDGSTDDTKQAVEQLQHLNGEGFFIKYIEQANQGAQVARNTGTAASKGEYIQYLDSDDLLFAGKLAAQVKYLQEHPACDGVFGDWRKGSVEQYEFVKAFASDDLISQMLTGRCIHTLSFLMRRSIVQKTGGWDPAIRRNQEIDFHIRALFAGGKFDYQPCDTGLWRIHGSERITNTTGLNEVVFFYQKMESLLKERQLFSKDLKEKISLLYMWLIAQYIDKPNNVLVKMLAEAKRLNPSISFYNNKMKWLTKVLGEKTALHTWLSWFRFNQKNRKA